MVYKLFIDYNQAMNHLQIFLTKGRSQVTLRSTDLRDQFRGMISSSSRRRIRKSLKTLWTEGFDLDHGRLGFSGGQTSLGVSGDVG